MTELLIGVLATYRVARMLAYEDGPWDLFLRWRSWIADRYDVDSWIARGFNCPLCLSFWIGMAIALIMSPATWSAFVLSWLAYSGGASWLVLQERSQDGIHS
jgi:hypothetical protein